MTCREFVDFLMAYLDGELPEQQGAIFEQHMRDCPACICYLDTYREAVRLGRSVCDRSEDGLPADVPEQLVRAILAARES